MTSSSRAPTAAASTTPGSRFRPRACTSSWSRARNGGAIEYTGIPYPVPAVGSSNSGVPYPIPGVRKAESGIPYPIPGVRKAESGIPYPIPGVRKAESTSTFSAGRGEGGVFKRINE